MNMLHAPLASRPILGKGLCEMKAPEKTRTESEVAAEAEAAPEVAAEAEAAPEAAAAPSGMDSQQVELAATVEALLFAADRPLTEQKLSQLGELGGVRNVRRAVAALNQRYERAGSVFRIVQIAGGYQMQTLPEYNDVVARLLTARREARLSQAAMETLAIVAYRQPVLRAEVEAIRGVACGEVLRGLMEKNLVRIAGRAQEIGRPLLYGTTGHFLEVFGLPGLEDLPNVEQLRMPAPESGKDEPGKEAPPGDDADSQPGEGNQDTTGPC